MIVAALFILGSVVVTLFVLCGVGVAYDSFKLTCLTCVDSAIYIKLPAFVQPTEKRKIN